jgi:hypothetical protein
MGVAMPASIESRLQRLEAAEEEREIRAAVDLFAEVYRERDRQLLEGVIRTSLGVHKRCAIYPEGSRRRIECLARGLEADPEKVAALWARWDARRAAGLTDEQIIREDAAAWRREEVERGCG